MAHLPNVNNAKIFEPEVSFILGEIMLLDLKKLKLRSVNEKLQNIDRKKNKRDFVISNPEGNHAVCAGLTDNIDVIIKGHVGYYCAGMNQNANITVKEMHQKI